MSATDLPPAVARLLEREPPAGGWLDPEYDPGLVSVIITTYNSETLIGETLGSILAQTYDKLEVIVADDGSTDGTREVLERWRERFRVERGWEFKVLSQPNHGQNSARNLGARASRGEYLNFFDSDDLMSAGRLTTMVEALRSGGLDVVHGPWVRFYPDRGGHYVTGQTFFDLGPDLLHSWLTAGSLIIWSCLLTRRFASSVGPFDDRLVGGNVGSEHILRLVLQQPRMACCQAPPIFYRRHRASVTFNLKPQAYANAIYWLTLLERNLEGSGRLAGYRGELAGRYRRYATGAYRDGADDLGLYCATRAAEHDPDFAPSRKLLRKVAHRLGGQRLALKVQGRTERLRRWRWRLASAVGLTPRLEPVTWVAELPLQESQK